MNENDINNNTTIVVAENEINGSLAVAYYDYYEVCERLDSLNSKVDIHTSILTTNFTYLAFIITLFVLYYLTRKIMGRS